MKRINQAGPPPVAGLDLPPRLSIAELAAALAAGMPVVDTRPAAVFGERAIPGTINIPAGNDFATWAGWLLPYDRPFALIAEEERLPDVVAQLRLIGLDRAAGYWPSGVVGAWAAAGRDLATIAPIDPSGLRDRRECAPVVVLDVRGAGEYATGHIAGSRHIPLGYLAVRLAEVPADRPVVVQCQSGARSAIGASILVAHGRRDVHNLAGGLAAWRAAGLPVERGVPEPALTAAR
jgi:hydroxyacylglutathione hydrolase